ncbi:MAG: divalent-cation tolerance protein CutA [Hyphomicrobium sp.]|uniref:divalent-cation tolerance protein CutA n=1 Tax=Hyphomicrobium sp. TaxID=82 RepID=UPI003D0CF42E
MQENDKAVLVYATYPSLETAEAEATLLVDTGQAASVNILPGVVSIYVWQGKRHRSAEVVLIAKTRQGLAERVVAAMRTRHPYEVPALLIVPVEGGLEDYLDWLRARTAARGATSP